ncbi:MAG: hypothetical protein RBU37_21415 [Myxococcota bacterium]|jgi:hypothetical protein|nr:hypothetical protein [Myxococcota bacterium]
MRRERADAALQLLQMWSAEGEQSTGCEQSGLVWSLCREPQAVGARLEELAAWIEQPCSLETLAATTSSLYDTLFRFVEERGLKLLRVWNYVPHILAPCAGGGLGYQAFNAGRYQAFQAHFGPPPWPVPAATAVANAEPRLRIEFLATNGSAHFLENPKQRPAQRYSARWGRLPPVFVRGVSYVRGAQAWLIASGTASVVGEETLHPGQLAAQLEQSLSNLGALVNEENLQAHGLQQAFTLQQLRWVRAYCTRPQDLEELRRLLQARLAESCGLELCHAALCREDLLVELDALFGVDAPA